MAHSSKRFANASENFDLKELVALHNEAVADHKSRKKSAASMAITRIISDSLMEFLHHKTGQTQLQSVQKNINYTAVQVLTQLKSPHAGGSLQCDMLHKKAGRENSNSLRAIIRKNSTLLLQNSLESVIKSFLMQDLQQKVAAVQESIIGRIIQENSAPIQEFLDAASIQDTNPHKYQNENIQESYSKYARIWIDQLTEGDIPWGKELYGTLCVDCLLLVDRVFTVLDDGENRGLVLSIYINKPPDAASQSRFLRKNFPRGLKLAIRDPQLVRTKMGCICIWVDNFEDSLIPVPSIPPVPSAIDLLTEGLRRSELGDIDTAIHLFTRALNSVRNVDSGNDAEIMKNLSELHYHRAVAYLKKGRNANALADVLFLQRNRDGRYQLLMNLLLEATENYEEAYLHWRLIIDKYGDLIDRNGDQIDKERYYRSLMENCKDLYIKKLRQQFKRFLATPRTKMKPCSSGFVGPIEIKVSAESSFDRGLFITRDCMAGDLLLVCNPVVDTMDEEQEAQDDISLGMHRFDAPSNQELQELHYKLAVEAKRSSPVLRKRIWALFSHHTSAPDIHLYWPEQYQQRKSEKDATEVQEAVSCPNWELQLADCVRLYVTGVQYPNKNEPSEAKFFCGLYLLPGFINHSCIPSASRFYVGKSMFVIAARDMKAGDEITFPYICAIHPLAERKQTLKEWGIHDCYCNRCKFESSISTMVPRISPALFTSVRNLKILEPMEREWYIASHQHWLLIVSHPNEYKSIGQEHASIFDAPSYYVDIRRRLKVLQAIQATVPGHPYIVQMLVKEAELIFVTNGSVESLELSETILNMARNAVYSAYGNELEAGLVTEVLSEISKSNKRYSKECTDIHDRQAAASSGQNFDHQQPAFPLLRDIVQRLTDRHDGSC